jgi:hypothetical protein
VSEIYLTRTLGGALKPADGTAEEYIASLGIGEVVRARMSKDRNPAHHRKYFGLLRMVFENQDRYLSLEALRFAIAVQSGYVEEIRLSGDAVAFKPKSISWSRMDQTQFNSFYQAALDAIPRLLPQFKDVDLDRELQLSS